MGKLIPPGGVKIPPPPPPPVKTRKICNRCQKEKPLPEFNLRSASSDGHRYTCRACDVEIKNAWKIKDREARARSKQLTRMRLAPAGSQAKPSPTDSPTEDVSEDPNDNLTEGNLPKIRLVNKPTEAPAPRIREVVYDGQEDIEKQLADEYASLLNEKLPVRRRANLMVQIAKMAKGPTAALALQALRDINTATGITAKSGQPLEAGKLFLLPEGTNMKLKGA